MLIRVALVVGGLAAGYPSRAGRFGNDATGIKHGPVKVTRPARERYAASDRPSLRQEVTLKKSVSDTNFLRGRSQPLLLPCH